jgi:hypothetical protein
MCQAAVRFQTFTHRLEVPMPSPAPSPTKELTAAERDWIRRQGMTARAVAAEQRRVRERLAAAAAETMRARDRPGRFRRSSG